MRLAKLGTRILDVLYPPCCVGCRLPLREGRSLCAACDGALPRLIGPGCRTCGEPFAGRIGKASDCPRCQQHPPAFDLARAALGHDPQVLELIHRFKYGREIHLAEELGRLAGESLADPRLEAAVEDGWPLVPVPLHRGRQRHRHFNQSAEIARVLSGRCGLPLLHALRRTRDTGSQAMLGRRQRLHNLKGSIALSRRGRTVMQDRVPAGVVLVDDVLTTGSTAHECARVLKQAGVGRVAVVAVMRG